MQLSRSSPRPAPEQPAPLADSDSERGGAVSGAPSPLASPLAIAAVADEKAVPKATVRGVVVVPQRELRAPA